jgi:predicted amidophosphoribosyltransferase
MGLAIVFLLTVIVAGILIYPLLPGRTLVQSEPAVTDGEIERAVRSLRRARSRSGLFCPDCGQGYKAGDRFCVRCGGELPQAAGAATESVCPSCGAPVQESDRFCAKCGHSMVVEEAA